MARSPRVGLRALMEVASLGPADLSAQALGFRLGPRINAAGRLSRADAPLELMLSEDPARAAEIAQELDGLNHDRREEETRILFAAEAAASAQAHRAAMVVAGEGWHPGVVGIVASRLVERWHRPCVVVAIAEDGTAKGSGRSISAYDLHAGLGACAELLTRFGGHRMAAGVELPRRLAARLRRRARRSRRRRAHARGPDPRGAGGRRAARRCARAGAGRGDGGAGAVRHGQPSAHAAGALGARGGGDRDGRRAPARALHAHLGRRPGAGGGLRLHAAGAGEPARATGPATWPSAWSETTGTAWWSRGCCCARWARREAGRCARSTTRSRCGRPSATSWRRTPLQPLARARARRRARCSTAAAAAWRAWPATCSPAASRCWRCARTWRGAARARSSWWPAWRPGGCLDAVSLDALARRPGLAARYTHLVALDPPPAPAAASCWRLRPPAASSTWPGERPRPSSRWRCGGPGSTCARRSTSVYRALREAGGCRGAELERLLRGDGAHPRAAATCARVVRVLLELEPGRGGGGRRAAAAGHRLAAHRAGALRGLPRLRGPAGRRRGLGGRRRCRGCIGFRRAWRRFAPREARPRGSPGSQGPARPHRPRPRGPAARAGPPGAVAGRRRAAPRACAATWASARRTGPRTCAGRARSPVWWPRPGVVAVVSLISPYAADRAAVRAATPSTACRSSRSSCPPRPRSARAATPRACGPGRGRAS